MRITKFNQCLHTQTNIDAESFCLICLCKLNWYCTIFKHFVLPQFRTFANNAQKEYWKFWNMLNLVKLYAKLSALYRSTKNINSQKGYKVLNGNSLDWIDCKLAIILRSFFFLKYFAEIFSLFCMLFIKFPGLRSYNCGHIYYIYFPFIHGVVCASSYYIYRNHCIKVIPAGSVYVIPNCPCVICVHPIYILNEASWIIHITHFHGMLPVFFGVICDAKYGKGNILYCCYLNFQSEVVPKN